MTINIDGKDPMPAIGFRLGLPEGVAFLEDRKDLVSALYGPVFLQDLIDAVRDGNLTAAGRVAEVLCPGVPFRVTEKDDEIEVSHDLEEESGRQTTRRIFEGVTPASCLVSAACMLKLSLKHDTAPEVRKMR